MNWPSSLSASQDGLVSLETPVLDRPRRRPID